jgi:hypothetical protein|tara:strand:+ start:383 stop:538 length:156 start_codon:yes stop_codon:yes gene_type:complete
MANTKQELHNLLKPYAVNMTDKELSSAVSRLIDIFTKELPTANQRGAMDAT